MLKLTPLRKTGVVLRTPRLDFVARPTQHLDSPDVTFTGSDVSAPPDALYKASAYNHIVPYSEERCVLFNAQNLATALLDTARRPELEQALAASRVTPSTLGAPWFDSLLAGGYLVPAELDEHALLRQRLARGRNQRKHLLLTLAPTMGCNFNCTYCVEPEALRRRVELMTEEVQDAIVELVRRELADPALESVMVAWFGGEPLLAIDVIGELSQRLIALCDERSVRYDANVTTNGYNLDDHAIAVLARCRVRFLKISLDGPKHVHDRRRLLRGGGGTFDRILRNIVAASGVLQVRVRLNVDRGNLSSLPQLLETLETRGLADKVQVYSAIVEENAAVEGRYSDFATRAEFAEAEHSMAKESIARGFARWEGPTIRGHYCSADLQRSYMLGPKGQLYACWADFGDPTKQVGSLVSRSINNSSYHEEFTRFDPTTHPKCAPCNVMPLCLGGCSRERLYHGEPQCGVYRFNLADRVREHVARQLGESAPASV